MIDSFVHDPLARHSALWGDQYALTMAQAFFTHGRHNINTTFHAFIRTNPFRGGYLVTAGQNIIYEWLAQHWRFDTDDIALLKRKTVKDPVSGVMKPLFTPEFIDMVSKAKMELTIHAMLEGELAFPDEPIMRVHGPLWQCLMVEGALLNTINSQSLFATLASRLVEVAEGKPVLEFGLRRAQAIGGLEPSRGAWIGGVTGTSNMLAEKYYGIPSTGTFAHAFVMVYEDELEAFKAYAEAMPYNGIFLVDTYDSLEGVRRAVKACQETGIKMKAIRLDSGDLTYLSRQARTILDKAGFTDTQIVASNDLDEETMAAIRMEGGAMDIWAVGTNLVTAKSQPALGGVYKLGAVYNDSLTQGEIDAVRTAVASGKQPHLDPDFMRDVIKISEQTAKVTIPGELDVLRFLHENDVTRYDGDVIVSTYLPDPVKDGVLVQEVRSLKKDDETQKKTFKKGTKVLRPLQKVFEAGRMISPMETVNNARERAARSLAMLDPTHRRLKNPHWYGVGLEMSLYQTRKDMIEALRRKR